VPAKKRTKTVRGEKPAAHSISIHRNLSEALASFLEKENLPGRETKEALASLVSLLSSYSEEGERLFPEVFVFDDVSNILQTLPNSERVVIGSGPKTPATLSLALKRSAPLARWGWSIYILRATSGFEYGLIRCGLTALSLTAPDLLIEQGDESLPALLIRHISHHTIEISGACQNSIRIHFGAVEQSSKDPLLVTRQFCTSIVRGVSAHLQEQVFNFYWRVFTSVLRGGHGCLAATLRLSKKTLPPQFKDGVAINPALDIAKKVESLLKRNDCESDIRLRATAALIRGMLSTDGITVFRTDGTVQAYNVFVKNPQGPGGSAALGGARRRAFEALCSWVGADLDSAFFLSQDGHAEYRGSTK
jgi:hypothetical protein